MPPSGKIHLQPAYCGLDECGLLALFAATLPSYSWHRGTDTRLFAAQPVIKEAMVLVLSRREIVSAMLGLPTIIAFLRL